MLQTAWESDQMEMAASDKSWNLQGWLSVGSHKLVQQTLRALVRRCSHPYAVSETHFFVPDGSKGALLARRWVKNVLHAYERNMSCFPPRVVHLCSPNEIVPQVQRTRASKRRAIVCDRRKHTACLFFPSSSSRRNQAVRSTGWGVENRSEQTPHVAADSSGLDSVRARNG